MTDWKERAERAEAELARLRAQEPEYWQWRRKRDPWEIGKTFNSQVYATTADSEVRCLYAAPPAQPAEPVQRLSDERAAFEAWHNEYRTQELVRRDDTYYNTHVRCRWEGWQARAIESALQPGWRDIESAPKDGTDVWLHADGKVLRAFWLVKPYRETRDLDGNYIDQQDYDEFWMSCADGDEVEDPTEWQPLVTPLPPKATK